MSPGSSIGRVWPIEYGLLIHLSWLEESSKRPALLIHIHSSINPPVTSPLPLGALSRPPCHHGRGSGGPRLCSHAREGAVSPVSLGLRSASAVTGGGVLSESMEAESKRFLTDVERAAPFGTTAHQSPATVIFSQWCIDAVRGGRGAGTRSCLVFGCFFLLSSEVIGEWERLVEDGGALGRTLCMSRVCTATIKRWLLTLISRNILSGQLMTRAT